MSSTQFRYELEQYVKISSVRKLTFKQKAFVKEYISNNGNGTQAVLKTYDVKNEEVARSIASENLTKPDVKETIQEILNRKGLGLEHISEEINVLANASVTNVSADVKLRSLDTLLKLHGAYPGTKHANVNINLRGKVSDMNFKDAREALVSLRGENDELLQETD